MSVTRFWLLLVAQVAATFIIGILFSFLTDYLSVSGFFGDAPCTTLSNFTGRPDCGVFFTNDTIWGTRHYLWSWMSFFIFVLQLIRVIHWIILNAEKIKG